MTSAVLDLSKPHVLKGEVEYISARSRREWTGRSWFNAAAKQYIWGDPKTTPAMPQFIVFEQSI